MLSVVIKLAKQVPKKLVLLFVLALCAVSMMVVAPKASAVTGVAPKDDAGCVADKNHKFLGVLPVWYEYVKEWHLIKVTNSQFSQGSCGIVHADNTKTAENIREDAVSIGLAVIDILLRLGALVAVGAVMLGGYKYMSSQGEPKNIEAAMATIVNAAIGLAIVLASTVLVAFIGHTLN